MGFERRSVVRGQKIIEVEQVYGRGLVRRHDQQDRPCVLNKTGNENDIWPLGQWRETQPKRQRHRDHKEKERFTLGRNTSKDSSH